MNVWWIRLARYARGYGSGLGIVLSLMLSGVALGVLKPWPMKLIVDHVLDSKDLPPGVDWLVALPGGGNPTALLGWLVVATVLLFVFGRTAKIAQSYVQAGVGSRMVHGLGEELFDHLQRLSLSFHGRYATGDLVRRVASDTTCVRELIMQVAIPILTSVVSLVAMFAVMWRLDPTLSLIAAVVAVPLAFLIRVFSGPMTERAYAQMEIQGEMAAMAEQTLSALPVVQAFGREEHEDRRFGELTRRSIRAHLRAVAAQLKFKVGTSGTIALGTAVVMTIGGLHVLDGSLSLGSLLVFLSYLASLYSPLETLAYVSSGYASAAAGARRVLRILEADEGVRESPGARSLPAEVRGHLRLEQVTFGYEAQRAVLHEVSIEARPGETVALVGPTGAGKSTLVSLIPRFFDPWQGRVTLDGMDIRELGLADVRSQVALVLQEPFLLPLTVSENIAYGRPGASEAEIVAAANAARADEFVRRLPQGYETVLGERGATLSGGEKQRLAIARALLKDAPILILDEPTAALDAETEAALMQALDVLMWGRTTFIIAHRLSTIERADRIVVIRDGRIVETGTHRELIETRGLYFRMQALRSSTAAAS